MKKAILKSGKSNSLLRFHPWIFSGAIHKIIDSNDRSCEASDGDLIQVYDDKKQFLAIGYYQQNSIAIRVLSFENELIDSYFWNKTLQSAFDHRLKLNLINNSSTNTFRLFHGEGDGVSGLIIDFYNGTAVIQCHTIGIYLMKDQIVNALTKVMGAQLKCVYNKSEDTLSKQLVIKYNVKNEIVWGEPQTNIVLENNHQFEINWETGQKTGFFIDQRDNRQLLANYAKEKSVLNTFCYSGAFSIYALQAGASLVHSVDSSAKAIDLIAKNITINNLNDHNHESYVSDVFDFFNKSELLYDIVILDPPAFAKHLDAKHKAIQGYKRLNIEGIKKVKPGGLLFTFSCSQAIDKYTFNQTIFSAAIVANRKIKVIHQLHQPADHAHSIFHPEGEYLKGLVLQIT